MIFKSSSPIFFRMGIGAALYVILFFVYMRSYVNERQCILYLALRSDAIWESNLGKETSRLWIGNHGEYSGAIAYRLLVFRSLRDVI